MKNAKLKMLHVPGPAGDVSLCGIVTFRNDGLDVVVTWIFDVGLCDGSRVRIGLGFVEILANVLVVVGL